MARVLGPASFGTFAVWQNNIQLFGTLGTVGKINHVIRETSRIEDPRSQLAMGVASIAVMLTVTGALFFGAGGAIIFLTMQDGQPNSAWLQFAATPLFALLTVLSAIHRGLGSLVFGVIFDRLISQILFLAFLLAAFGAWRAELLATMTVFTLTLAVAAVASLFYLIKNTGVEALKLKKGVNLLQDWRNVLPFFLVNALFVINARYLLSYAGIFVDGDVLGQVGLIFTVVAMMVIPISSLELVAAPYLATKMQEEGARRAIINYLAVITAIVAAGLIVISLAYPLIFELAAIERTISLHLVLLLSAAFGFSLIANGGLSVLQFAGREHAAAKLLGIATTAKLIVGYLVGKMYGLVTLFGVDLAITIVFATAVISKALTVRRRPEAGDRQSTS
ncbi:hypothetical protein [Sphingomonas sabuli]|nr:hypothetical protein [Sphingomonas sabuli]